MCGCKGKCGCNINQTTKGEKGDNGAGLIYKNYVVLLQQGPLDVPQVILLYNDLGFTPIWERLGAGTYVSNNVEWASYSDKTYCSVTQAPVYNSGYTHCSFDAEENRILIFTYNNLGVLADDLLSDDDLYYKTNLEIKVYN
jgi:hypothetical protein